MLQSWNKFCLTGGVVEMSAKFPGRPVGGLERLRMDDLKLFGARNARNRPCFKDIPGLWPAFWLLGNLGPGPPTWIDLNFSTGERRWRRP